MNSDTRMAPPKNSIGGTTATQILGHNKYGGKHAAYRKLVRGLEGLPDETPQNFSMYRGMVAEEPIVSMIKEGFLSETGFYLGELFGSGVIRHGRYPFIHATVDRLLIDSEGKFAGILEVKTVNRSPGRLKYWDMYPDGNLMHLTQIDHYVAVLESSLGDSIAEGGLTENYLLVAEADEEVWSMAVRLIQDGHGLDAIAPLIDVRWLKVGLNESYEEAEMLQLVEFWTRHIEPRSAPEVDGSEDCTATIIDQIPLRDGKKEIEEGGKTYNEVADLVAEYDFQRNKIKEIEYEMQQFKDEIKNAKIRQSEIKNRLSFIAGESSVMESDRFRVKISRSIKGKGFDADRFRIENPEEWNRYQKDGRDSERVTITTRVERKDDT